MLVDADAAITTIPLSTPQTHDTIPGTGNLVGTPKYVGGTGMAAYKLAPDSPGHAAASDGTDIGARIP